MQREGIRDTYVESPTPANHVRRGIMRFAQCSLRGGVDNRFRYGRGATGERFTSKR
jgi:hypothetical protein